MTNACSARRALHCAGVQCLLALTHRSMNSAAMIKMLLRLHRWHLFTQWHVW